MMMIPLVSAIQLELRQLTENRPIAGECWFLELMTFQFSFSTLVFRLTPDVESVKSNRINIAVEWINTPICSSPLAQPSSIQCNAQHCPRYWWKPPRNELNFVLFLLFWFLTDPSPSFSVEPLSALSQRSFKPVKIWGGGNSRGIRQNTEKMLTESFSFSLDASKEFKHERRRRKKKKKTK